ncbi:MAG: hypothetical protein WBC18_04480 [Ottowia sp.]|uniref:hypothetical protein n=1 Tax=Ottowia sp. TaxID=1898956 RepID=UPI003C7642C6
MTTALNSLRQRGFADFSATAPEALDHRRHWLMRAQNFSTEWIEFDEGSAAASFDSGFEALIVGVRGSVRISPANDRTLPAEVPADSIAITPAGAHSILGEPGSACVVIASQRTDLAGRRVLNAESYTEPDPRILPAGQPFRRTSALRGIQVLAFNDIMASPERPRLKMLQTDTLSINLVDYQGPRDRRMLSPHSHTSFEQGSLAVTGNFVHHLRAPWGNDANTWADDEHLPAPSPSLVVVPVEIIHTTEGIGEMRHVLFDIFSPPRADFIGNGWIFNARDYAPSHENTAS